MPRHLLTMAVFVLAGSALISPSRHTATPVVSASAAAQAPATSTLADQTELAVTVYNSDLALVRDVRRVRLASGVGDLHFMDIAATVNPASVHFRSLTDAPGVNVLEQNYEYDLLDPDKLLRKYVGREVTLVRRVTAQGTTRDEEVRAELLSDNSSPVWRINGEIVTGLGADHIRFPEVPGNLFSRPTLIWTLDNRGASQHRVETSYLASKLSWNADYVLTVTRDGKLADLNGWVTVRNDSGTSFPNASLQLVAGELNRVRQQMSGALRDDVVLLATAALTPPMQQESFSDYHLYSLTRKTSINNSETKQVSMLSATQFPVRKHYVVDGQPYYYRGAYQSPGAARKQDVQMFFDLKNEAAAGLGMPMPAGVVRVYQADSRGGTQFVGEDRIGHTPKDEALHLRIGTAFDVVCERKQVDFQRISSNVFESEFLITLRNHKPTPVTVDVNEPIGGTWQMLRQSHPWTRTAAWAAQFQVPVAPDGTTALRYRVRVTD